MVTGGPHSARRRAVTRSRAGLVIAAFTAACSAASAQPDPDADGRASRAAPRRLREVTSASVVRPVAPSSARQAELFDSALVTQRRRAAGGQASGAGTHDAYRNEVTPIQFYYAPGAGELMSDDLLLALSACDVTGYTVGVVGRNRGGPPTFDVQAELWTSDPCLPGAEPLPGTQSLFAELPNDGATAYILEVSLPQPVQVEGSAWLALTFSSDDGGWIVAEQAELGATANLWSENDPSTGCGTVVFSDGHYGGFWGSITCAPPQNPQAVCCLGATCVLTDRFDCRWRKGHFLDGVVDCVGQPCSTGACCTSTPGCLDDDGFGGPMDSELCDIVGGTYVGGALCELSDPCSAARIPPGYETVEVASGMMWFGWPSLNDCGEIVYHTRIGLSWADAEIFLANNGTLTQVTRNRERDVLPVVNGQKSIVWNRGVGDAGVTQIVSFDGIRENLITVGFPTADAFSETGHITWSERVGDCPPEYDVLYFNGMMTRRLYADGTANQGTSLNNLGEVAWTRFVLPCEFSQNWTSMIKYYHSGQQIDSLPSSRAQPQAVSLNNGGTLVWSDFDLVELWHASQLVLVADGHLPSINDRSDIAYQFLSHVRHFLWEVWLVHGAQLHCLTNPADPFDNRRPSLNEIGEVAWTFADPVALQPAGIRYMRRIRNGDVDFDGDEDGQDFLPWPACFTGSVETVGLCE